MISLNHVKPLPPNSEWAYLYAVASVYQNESSPYLDKADPEAPRPLMDKEVQKILATKYGLPNVHRNTIASIRRKLTEYFGFQFGAKGKRKYLLNRNLGATKEEYALAAYFATHNPFLTNDQAERVNRLIIGLCPFPESKKLIRQHNRIIKAKESGQVDITKTAALISKAIAERKRIRFRYPGKREEEMTLTPLSLAVSKDDHLTVTCEHPKDWIYYGHASYIFDLCLMTEVKIVKSHQLVD